MLLDSVALQVNLARMVPKESQEHVVSEEKPVPQVFQELRAKMGKMGHQENPVQTDFQVLQENGVPLDSEDLQVQMAFREKRVLLGSVVAQDLQGPEERLVNLVEMVPQETQE